MHTPNAAHRYALLRAELRQRLAASPRWSGLPDLLDEMHAVRLEHDAQGGERPKLTLYTSSRPAAIFRIEARRNARP